MRSWSVLALIEGDAQYHKVNSVVPVADGIVAYSFGSGDVVSFVLKDISDQRRNIFWHDD